MLLDNDEVSGPDLAVFRCSGAPGRNQRAQLRQKFGDHKELAEGGMCPVSFRCGQHDLGVRGELDTAGAATTVVQRDTSYFAIRFTGHQDFQCGGQAVVMMNELCPILCKNNFPLVVGIAQRVRTRRPGLTTVNIVQKEERTPVVPSSILMPAGDGNVAPTAIAGSRTGEHDVVATVGEQVGHGGTQG